MPAEMPVVEEEVPDQAPVLLRTRSGRVPDTWFRLHTAEEGYKFNMLGNDDIKTTDDTVGARYGVAANEIARSESNLKTSKVMQFMCAQIVYINSMHTYSQIDMATRNAIEHLIFTQVGMKKGIKMWDEKGTDAIIKEMR